MRHGFLAVMGALATVIVVSLAPVRVTGQSAAAQKQDSALLAAPSGCGATPSPCAPVEDIPGLPRVLIIGDSISMNYTLPLREVLRGKANLHRIPDNGATTRRSWDQFSLDEWIGKGKWDVIHCNWGLHDVRIMENGKDQVPIEEYEKNLDGLISYLQKKTGARIIFATTTPVPEGNVSPLRRPADVVHYNEVAVRVMKAHNVAVNDLYASVLPKLKTPQQRLQLPVNVHFTNEGARFLAEQVAAAILNALKGPRGVRIGGPQEDVIASAKAVPCRSLKCADDEGRPLTGVQP